MFPTYRWHWFQHYTQVQGNSEVASNSRKRTASEQHRKLTVSKEVIKKNTNHIGMHKKMCKSIYYEKRSPTCNVQRVRSFQYMWRCHYVTVYCRVRHLVALFAIFRSVTCFVHHAVGAVKHIQHIM